MIYTYVNSKVHQSLDWFNLQFYPENVVCKFCLVLYKSVAHGTSVLSYQIDVPSLDLVPIAIFSNKARQP